MRTKVLLLPILLVLLLVTACSRPAESPFDFFPDSKGSSRQYQVLVDGYQRGFVRVVTESLQRQPDRLGLVLTDPRRADILGREALLITSQGVQFQAADFDLLVPLLEWPPEIGGDWKSSHEGIEFRCVDMADLKVTAGSFKHVLQMHYRVAPDFMQSLGFNASDTLNIRLWLAPQEGPIKLQVGEHIVEELVERW